MRSKYYKCWPIRGQYLGQHPSLLPDHSSPHLVGLSLSPSHNCPWNKNFIGQMYIHSCIHSVQTCLDSSSCSGYKTKYPSAVWWSIMSLTESWENCLNIWARKTKMTTNDYDCQTEVVTSWAPDGAKNAKNTKETTWQWLCFLTSCLPHPLCPRWCLEAPGKSQTGHQSLQSRDPSSSSSMSAKGHSQVTRLRMIFTSLAPWQR